jgi:dipeptidyl-peptidase-3
MTKEVLERLSKKSPKLESLCEKIAAPILSIPPWSLGYPSNSAQSSYYPDSVTITKDEIRAVSQSLGDHSIYPENTRIRKIVEAGKPVFEILTASARTEVEIKEWELPELQATVRFKYGDHAKEMTKICECLAKASEFAANENQRLFIAQYIESFQTGSLDAYRDSQRTWVKDKSPSVENIFGFVEPYRDPNGSRSEFEGLVAIPDEEETRLLAELVQKSATFIRRLPWAEGSNENDGKGPFEKSLFEAPDFTSIHSEFIISTNL